MRTALVGVMTGVLMAGTLTATHAVNIASSDQYPTSLYIEGEFKLGDDGYFNYVLKQRESGGQMTEFVLLNSPGGKLFPAWLISQIVRARNMTTVVGSDDECSSACTLVFAGGTNRRLWLGGQIGVHNASEQDGSPSDGATIGLSKRLAEYDVPVRVIGKMVVTPPDSITWLTEEDMAGWVTILRPQTSYVPPQEPARPQPSPSPSGKVGTMQCRSTTTGNYYPVWLVDRNSISVNGRIWPVEESHRHKGTGAWVAGGHTHIRTNYDAVFGGPNPRVEYWNGKEIAKDHCIYYPAG